MHRNGEHQCEKHQIKFTYEALQNHNARFHTKKNKKSDPCPVCQARFAKIPYLGNPIMAKALKLVR